MRQSLLIWVLALFLIEPGLANAEEVKFSSDQWVFEGEDIRTETYLGKDSLFLRNATALLPEVNFSTGIIEYDIAVAGERGFPGLRFHISDAGNFENFYIRPHQSSNDDANQYQPVLNGNTGWQIYYGPQYSRPIPYKYNTWMKVKVVVGKELAEFYVDSDEPVFVSRLLHPSNEGGLGLQSNFAGVRFANFRFTPDPDPAMTGARPVPDAAPDGTVQFWEVSDRFEEGDIEGLDELHTAFVAAREWRILEVEANGIANIGRLHERGEGVSTVLARLVLDSDTERTLKIPFGFSDKVRVFVNDRIVFEGDDTYQSRDYRHLGTVGLYDAVYARLRTGRNEIVFAVGENFGGWAIAATLPDMAGVRQLRPE